MSFFPEGLTARRVLGRGWLVFLALGLIVSLLMAGFPASVLADDDEEEITGQGEVTVAAKHGLPPGQAKKWAARWRFVDEDEVNWGHEYMAKMKGKGLIQGRGQGQFAPQARVTMAEAVTMAVRLMGLEEQARQRTEAQLRFSNALQVAKLAPWAVGYLDVAGENGLVDAGGVFQPNDPADRIDVVVMLVKAMGLEDEAEASKGVVLSFRDAGQISAELVGYVVVALKYGLVTGYDDRTFRPHQPVRRIEMAALLDRADILLPPRSPYRVEGRLVSASEADNTVTLDVYRRWWPWPPWWPIRPPRPPIGPSPDGQIAPELVSRQEYKVSPDALILLNNQPVSLGDLPAEAWTHLVLNTEKVAVVIDAHAGYRIPVPAIEEREGTVTALDTEARTITIHTEKGEEVTLRLAEQVRVRYRGEETSLDEVRVGDQVELRLQNQLVTRLVIEERERREFAGTITALTTAGDGTVTLTVYGKEGETLTARVAADAEIEYEDETLPVTELGVGDKVEVVLEEGVIVKIKVEERPEATITATVQAITQAENRWTVTLRDLAGNTLTYPFSSRVQVRFQGEAVGVAGLRVGDLAQVRVAGGVIYRVDIVARGS